MKKEKMVTSAWVELKNEEDPDSPETPDTFWYYFERTESPLSPSG